MVQSFDVSADISVYPCQTATLIRVEKLVIIHVKGMFQGNFSVAERFCTK